MRKMYSKKQVEEIALNKIEEGKINKTVTLYDGDENPEYPISIDFSQEVCNNNEQPTLEFRVGDEEAEVGEISLSSGYTIYNGVPNAEFYLASDEGIVAQAEYITFTASNTSGANGEMYLTGAESISISSGGSGYQADGQISLVAKDTHNDAIGNIDINQNGLAIGSGGTMSISAGGDYNGTISMVAQDQLGNGIGSIDLTIDGVTINPDVDGQGQGYLILEEIPTSDPQVAGAVWNDNGVLKISSGE